MRRLQQVAAGVEHHVGRRIVRLVVLRHGTAPAVQAAIAGATARGRRWSCAPNRAKPSLRRASCVVARRCMASRAMVSMKRGFTPCWQAGMQWPLPEHTAAQRADASGVRFPTQDRQYAGGDAGRLGRVDPGRARASGTPPRSGRTRCSCPAPPACGFARLARNRRPSIPPPPKACAISRVARRCQANARSSPPACPARASSPRGTAPACGPGRNGTAARRRAWTA